MKAECLDFRKLPGINPLFLDFLDNFEKVAPFYSPVHLSPDHLVRQATLLLERGRNYPRRELAELLNRYAQSMGAPRPVTANLEKLTAPDTVAVVTGQQVGLFGGPALAFYKAATAVTLARLLNERGISAVPVFWMASDDSDFQEARSTFFASHDSRLLEVTYPGPSKNTEKMVGSISLDSVSSCLDCLSEAEGDPAFQTAVLQTLQRSYQPASNFREAFAGWMNELLGDLGLIIFDAMMGGYKALLTRALARVVTHRSEIVRELMKRSELLQSAGYSAQVHVEESETLLFWIDKDRRRKLHFSDGQFRTDRSRGRVFSEAELLKAIDETPDQFGPNVLLRPILQDHLFPTAAYVGGPSEVAYFSQIQAISSLWDLELSIFPRAALTVVDRKSQRYLQKYGLTVPDLMSSDELEIVRRTIGQNGEDILAEFRDIKSGLEDKLDGLDARLEPVDPTVAEMLGRARQKIFYQLEKVEHRFVSNHRVRDQHLGRHLDHLYSHVFPRGKLQERVFNFNQFLLSEGPDFPSRILSHIRPFCHAHQLIYL